MTSSKQRLAAVRDHLLQGLVERDVAVRLGLLAAVAGEHLLLIGPPGTAKSLLAQRLRGAFADATYFERLLTRFTVPEELFGPLSIKGLEQDRYVRQTRGYLPEASIAFLDEIFKANSAILNALLTLLNERAFDNDGQRQACPLISVVGASNELPESGELDALYDRFLLRYFVGPITADSVDDLLDLDPSLDGSVPDALRLSPAHLDGLRQASRAVALAPDLRDLLKDLRAWAAEQGIALSDRRLRKVVGLLQVAASTDGRPVATVWDAWLLQHCVWDDPVQREAIADWWGARVGTLRATSPTRLLEMVAAWEERLAAAAAEQEQQRDGRGQALFTGSDGTLTAAAEERKPILDSAGRSLYLAPPTDSYGEPRPSRIKPGGGGYTEGELDALDLYDDDDGGGQFFRAWRGRAAYLADADNLLSEVTELAPAMGPRRHPRAHVQGWLDQLSDLESTIRGYLGALAERRDSLDVVRGHLWVPSGVVAGAEATLDASESAAGDLLQRLAALQQGFRELPVSS